MRYVYSLFIRLLLERLYVSPGLNHRLPGRQQRTSREVSGKSMREIISTHASASFSAFSAKVTLFLAASSDRSLPRTLRPASSPVPAVLEEELDPTLPRRVWRVESTSELPVERRRKNPRRELLPVVVVSLMLGAVVRVPGAVVAALSAGRDEEKMVPRLRGGAVSGTGVGGVEERLKRGMVDQRNTYVGGLEYHVLY